MSQKHQLQCMQPTHRAIVDRDDALVPLAHQVSGARSNILLQGLVKQQMMPGVPLHTMHGHGLQLTAHRQHMLQVLTQAECDQTSMAMHAWPIAHAVPIL
jgi:hypothetical protein